jgi:hypothetical protein
MADMAVRFSRLVNREINLSSNLYGNVLHLHGNQLCLSLKFHLAFGWALEESHFNASLQRS